MTDLHDLITRMADELDHYRQLLTDDRREVHALAMEARAALAEPERDGALIPAGYIHRQGNHWELSERPLLDDEIGRGWTQETVYRAALSQPEPEVVGPPSDCIDALCEIAAKLETTP